MRCSECQYENREGAKFCRKCGNRLELVCPECQHHNEPDSIFCDECGAKIALDTPTAAAPLDEQKDVPDELLTVAERRQVTVMFCDMVGSTPLSEQLDPEELRDVLHDYQSSCAKVIRGYDGHIARYLGDGILVYFGYPVAHEDDAQRAVRAGLGIVEGMKQLNTRLQQERSMNLEVRLGIHTGVVVAGDMDQNEQLESMAIVGETPNIADRLQKLAEPNTLVISSITHQLIEGFFDCRSLGSHPLEGISQPVEVYQVLHESAARTRLDKAELTGLTPLVGREQELSLLLDRWKQVREGMGHVVLLGGEAGIGKSRMVKVLMERIAEEPQAWLTECRCSPYHQNTILYPVVELFERTIPQFDRNDSPEEKLSKVEAFLVRYGLPLDKTLPLFATFLSIPLSDSYSPLNITPKQQKERTINTLIDILIQRASQQPVLFVVEDLHWADASSLELLDLLIERGPVSGLFTLFTFRPSFTPPWTGRSHLTYVTLNRLTPKQVSDMVKHIAVKPLPDQVMEQIVSRTDGVALFVEELTRMVLESGLLREQDDRYELTGPLPPLAIPATLHESLIARLDRLSEVKEVAQLGAIIGREFSYELLQVVSPLDDETLEKALAQLVDVELLYQRGLPPQATYVFKHALIRDTAYQSLLRSKRHQYHQRIAQALEERFSAMAEVQPEILAHHYTESGLDDQAILYWLEAGQQAVKRSANVEAINHLNQGLELIEKLPETIERVQQELDLQISLSTALMATRGHGVPEVAATFTRALELCHKLGETPQLFWPLRGLTIFYAVRAEWQTAQELAERIFSIAQDAQDPSLLIEAYLLMGEILFYLGEFASSLEHTQRGFALYHEHTQRGFVLHDPQQHRDFVLVYMRDPGVAGLNYISWALSFLGYPDKALKRINEALRLAQELVHPYSIGHAMLISGLLHQSRREVSAAQERAVATTALATEYSFPLILAAGNIVHGWALAEQRQIDEGIGLMQQGIDTWRAMDFEFLRPAFSSWLAEALGKMGQTEEALAILAEALAMMDRTGERFYEAELHRLKGELMLMQGGDEAEVEACFHRAIEVARCQQAKSWELRATVSLCRFWQKQGKTEEARKILQEIYDWFTEGFDTKDMKEAKALLEELS